MNKINKEMQYVICKMNTSLVSKNPYLVINLGENWLHSQPNTEKNSTVFDVQYTFANLDLTLQKDDYLSFAHFGNYKCSLCQKMIKKIYSGFCYVCLMKKACADMCVMNPSNCHFLKGTCREPEWGLSFCYQPHYVYLAFTDKFKVGITRQKQILTRWADQGATMASIICLVSSRHQAGNIEKSLTAILSDRSHWQKMLKSGNSHPSQEEFQLKWSFVINWLKEALIKNPNLVVQLPSEVANLQKENTKQEQITFFENPVVVKLNYPVPDTIDKIKSVSLEKVKEVKGKITGIKGQYIFLGEQVINVRSHEGFVVDLESY